MTLNPILVICLILASVVLLAGLFRPFLGMMAFLVIHFVQPGELVPAIAPLRIELVYGILLIGILLFRRATIPGHSLFSDKILLGALLLICAGLLSVPFSVWRAGAAVAVIDMLKLATLLFLLILLVDSQARLRMTLWCVVAMATWFAGSSLYAYTQGQFYGLGTLRRAEGVNSIAGGPNELAGLLFALLPLLIALYRSTYNIFGRILLLTCGALSLVAISLTGARIVVIALIVLSLFYTMQSKHKFSTFFACVVIAFLIWHSLPVEYKERYLTLGTMLREGSLMPPTHNDSKFGKLEDKYSSNILSLESALNSFRRHTRCSLAGSTSGVDEPSQFDHPSRLRTRCRGAGGFWLFPLANRQRNGCRDSEKENSWN